MILDEVELRKGRKRMSPSVEMQTVFSPERSAAIDGLLPLYEAVSNCRPDFSSTQGSSIPILTRGDEETLCPARRAAARA